MIHAQFKHALERHMIPIGNISVFLMSSESPSSSFSFLSHPFFRSLDSYKSLSFFFEVSYEHKTYLEKRERKQKITVHWQGEDRSFWHSNTAWVFSRMFQDSIREKAFNSSLFHYLIGLSPLKSHSSPLSWSAPKHFDTDTTLWLYDKLHICISQNSVVVLSWPSFLSVSLSVFSLCGTVLA